MPDLSPPLDGGRYVELAGRGRTWIWDSGPPLARTGGAGDAPTVLLVHGWTSTSALTWFRCFRPLAQEARVVAMDLRGHGRGLRSRRPFRLEDCADDQAALIEQLGLGPVIAVGYSMGGPVVQLLGRRHPALVRGLVLCATAAEFPPIRPNRGLLLTTLGVGLSAAAAALPEALRRRILRRLLRRRPDFDTMARWAADECELGDLAAYVQALTCLHLYDATAWIGRLDVAAIVLLTTLDVTVPPHRQRRLAEAIGGTVVELEAGHRACADAPELFVPALIDACRQLGGYDPLAKAASKAAAGGSKLSRRR